jgi:hypothetical protein
MFASARDVTDAVRAEQELREAKEQLESAWRTHARAAGIHRSLARSERRFRALIEHGRTASRSPISRGASST